MKFEEAIAEIEDTYRCVAGIPGPTAQTGEEYLEFTPFPAGDESKLEIGFASTETLVALGFIEGVRRYADSVLEASGVAGYSSLTLYWRIYPEIERNTTQFKKAVANWKKPRKFELIPVWRMYARLLITAKPEIESLDSWLVKNPGARSVQLVSRRLEA